MDGAEDVDDEVARVVGKESVGRGGGVDFGANPGGSGVLERMWNGQSHRFARVDGVDARTGNQTLLGTKTQADTPHRTCTVVHNFDAQLDRNPCYGLRLSERKTHDREVFAARCTHVEKNDARGVVFVAAQTLECGAELGSKSPIATCPVFCTEVGNYRYGPTTFGAAGSSEMVEHGEQVETDRSRLNLSLIHI